MIHSKSIGSTVTITDIIIVSLLLLVLVITLYPLYYVAIISISDGLAVMRGEVTLWPKGLTLDSYRVITQNKDLFRSFRNTVVYTVLGTGINLIMSCFCAYPLSRKSFSGRKFFTKMIVITMFVSGGMIPGYLLVSSLGLLDTMWSVLLPVAINTYNMIVIRTSFQSLPESLIESAKIDGANDFYILGKIVMPLSKAVLATMVLFYSVSHWNNYFSPMIYLNTKSKYPLQIILRNLVVSGMFSEESSMMGSVSQFRVTEMTIRYAVIIFATLPILCVYPFVQKYFVKGVMIGSLKE
mgnify:CR=1 FL=1